MKGKNYKRVLISDCPDYDVTEGLVDYLNTVILGVDYQLVRIVERQSIDYDKSYECFNF